jgi:outer membrane protein OmpU
MKKVLFATTALVATAGVASADVSLSGSAEMGINGGSSTTTEFFQDLDVTFTMSGTADNGLTFGAAVDLDESNCDTSGGGCTPGAFAPNDDGGTAIFISGDFGTLTMGDTDGALDWALTEVNIGSPGSIDDSETGHAGYNGNSALDGHYDGQVLRYDYSFGDFGVALSVEADDDTTAMGSAFNLGVTQAAGVTGDPVWGVGANYSGMFAGGSFGVGIGYQFTNDGDQSAVTTTGVSVWGISGSVELDSGFAAAANYSAIEIDGANNDGVHMGIGASYTFDAISVHANYGEFDWDPGALSADSDGFGLAAAYDFGGGLSAHLAYGYSDITAVNATAPAATLGDSNTWSFGLSMSF